ncbi:LLM class flavin-dependent oxidoreductase [Mycolicibacterium sp.]|uniref:LLM class flavin-dependent oxidoreductase n=1 Tax=Mycolicibacterium sp. TaxID=2320850 RepID=UPI001A27E59E|nr:LLM class flavin-dependent oxidoreductase [Mycolicibacterium sp.]MBJ7336390.1 LLM class flavin-dependent oxidoreductase [Mycolicibacterium sp.]
MKVGLYFDLRNPPGWHQEWQRLYGFTLEVCEEADRLGIGSLWFSEHHLFSDGYLNQPLTFAAAAAARTTQTRLGTAVMVAPIRRAAQIAEEATVVDLVSGGRLDLGLGTGYRKPEFDLYEESLIGRYDRTDARVREMRALWASGTLTPPPVQDSVPIWLGYQGPKGARRAGVLGEGLLSVNRDLLEPYREGLIAGGHDPASARMAGALSAFVTDDPERDWPIVSKHVSWQADSYRAHMVDGTDQPPPKPVDAERIRSKGLTTGFHGLLVDTPQNVATQVRDVTEGLPVETVFFWVSIAGMPEEMVMRHMQIICTDLAPLLADS